MLFSLEKKDEDFLLSCGLGLSVMQEGGGLHNKEIDLQILGLKRKRGNLVSVVFGERIWTDRSTIPECMKDIKSQAKAVIESLEKEAKATREFLVKIEAIDFQGDLP